MRQYFVLDWVGLGCIGLGWVGLGWIGLNWVGLGWIGLDWVGFCQVGMDSHIIRVLSFDFINLSDESRKLSR